MNHLVTKLFSDKELGLFLPNSFYPCEDYKRIQHLSSLGFIIPNSNTEQLNKPVEEVKEEVKPKPTRKATTRKKAVDTDVTKG
ncbi:hypothetical protein ACE1MS_11765 [Lysinibacillus sp. fkY74-1]